MKIVFIFVCFVVVYIIVNFIVNTASPEEKIEAVLAGKIINSHTDANNMPYVSYTLCFDTAKEKKKFNVKKADYEKYSRGEQGTLIYKGRRFVDFEIE